MPESGIERPQCIGRQAGNLGGKDDARALADLDPGQSLFVGDFREGETCITAIVQNARQGKNSRNVNLGFRRQRQLPEVHISRVLANGAQAAADIGRP